MLMAGALSADSISVKAWAPDCDIKPWRSYGSYTEHGRPIAPRSTPAPGPARPG